MELKIISYDKEEHQYKAREIKTGKECYCDPFVGCAYNGKPEDLIDKIIVLYDYQIYMPTYLPENILLKNG